MSITSDAETLGQRSQEISDAKGEPVNLFDHRHVHIGYRFALLKSGRITLDEFCEEVWTRSEIDDAFEEYFPDVFRVWAENLATDSDDGPDPLLKAYRTLGNRDAEFIDAAQARFGPFVELAEGQYRYLVTQAAEDVLSTSADGSGK